MTTFRREHHPVGSHLSAAVYSKRKNSEDVFTTMYELVRDSVESSGRYLDVAPRAFADDENAEVLSAIAKIDFDAEGVPLPCHLIQTTYRYAPTPPRNTSGRS